MNPQLFPKTLKSILKKAENGSPTPPESTNISFDDARTQNIIRTLMGTALIGGGAAGLFSILSGLQRSFNKPSVNTLPYGVTLKLPVTEEEDTEKLADTLDDAGAGAKRLATHYGSAAWDSVKDIFNAGSHTLNPMNPSDAQAIPMWGGMGLSALGTFFLLRELLKADDTGATSDVDRARNEFNKALTASPVSFKAGSDAEACVDLMDTMEKEAVSAWAIPNIAAVPILALMLWNGVNAYENEKNRREGKIKDVWSKLKGSTSPRITAELSPGQGSGRLVQLHSLKSAGRWDNFKGVAAGFGNNLAEGAKSIVNLDSAGIGNSIKNWASSNPTDVQDLIGNNFETWFSNPANKSRIDAAISKYIGDNKQQFVQQFAPEIEGYFSKKYPWMQTVGNIGNWVSNLGSEFNAGAKNFGNSLSGMFFGNHTPSIPQG